jgi:hypothetical protein
LLCVSKFGWLLGLVSSLLSNSSPSNPSLIIMVHSRFSSNTSFSKLISLEFMLPKWFSLNTTSWLMISFNVSLFINLYTFVFKSYPTKHFWWFLSQFLSLSVQVYGHKHHNWTPTNVLLLVFSHSKALFKFTLCIVMCGDHALK